MMMKMLGSAWTVLCAVVVLSIGGWAHGQQSPSIPPFKGERVIVEGVPDRYEALKGQIAKLEKSSPQTYYVVVVKSTGPGAKATGNYAEKIVSAWSAQRKGRGPSFDPDRSVVIVVALDNRQVAVKPGRVLRDEFGLHANRVELDLIPSFIALAKENRYADGLSALLDTTNNWIAARHDSGTPYVAVSVPASKAAAAPAKVAVQPSQASADTAGVPAPLTASKGVTAVTSSTEPQKQGSSEWLPVIIVGVPILLMLFAFGSWIWHLYRRAQGRVAGRIREVKSKAADVMDKLDGLKERLKLMPTSTDFQQAMSGETQTVFNAVNTRLGTLWDGWLKIMDVLEKAQKLAAKSGSPLSQKTLAEAEELITKQGSFAEIETQAHAIEADIDRLEHAHQVARSVLEAVAVARPKTDAGLESVKKLGLSTAPYQDELTGIDTALAHAKSVLVADPLGTKTSLEALRDRSDALLARIERVVALFGDAQKVKSSFDTIAKQVAGQRAAGLKLVEENGNPDRLLSEGADAHREALGALEAGDPDGASAKLELARGKTKDAQATIEKVQKSRAFCERELPARARETERLRAALPQAESYQADLEREFARSSWQAVARNLDQIHSLLATFDRQAEQAAALVTTTRQEYVRGAGLVEELARQQQIVLRLMSGLGEQLNGLVNVRGECRKLTGDLAATERQAELLIRQNEAIVSDVARNSLNAARRAKEDVLARSEAATPDWPALHQSLTEVIGDLTIAQSQAEEDINNHAALVQEFEQVRDQASRVYAFLSSHSEDRLAANQHYQAAADALDRVGLEIAEPQGRSGALLEQVRGAAADLTRAEELAREDIRLAAQAQSQIAEAGQAISKARGYSSMGFGVDTSASESQVLQAQNFLQSQNYEQSIQLAGSAMQRAQQLYYAAMQEAFMRQMTTAAEQRRRVVRSSAPPWNGVSFGTAAATAAAAAILERATVASPPSVDFGSSSETAVGSWDSDTGQGSW
jgi:uncharacterized membrane protein YgcG